MYVIDSGNKMILNADFVERFCIAEKDDAALIVASYGSSRQPITIGRYLNKKEAQNALSELVSALIGDQAVFYMPDSLLYGEQAVKKDARVKRKGGS